MSSLPGALTLGRRDVNSLTVVIGSAASITEGISELAVA